MADDTFDENEMARIRRGLGARRDSLAVRRTSVVAAAVPPGGRRLSNANVANGGGGGRRQSVGGPRRQSISVNGVQMIIGSKPWQLGNQCHEEDDSDEDEVGPSMDPRAKKRSRHINETNNEIFRHRNFDEETAGGASRNGSRHHHKSHKSSKKSGGSSKHKHRHHSRHHKKASSDSKQELVKRPATPPNERVVGILGIDIDHEEPPPLFSEMLELYNNDSEWNETARWVKFEEQVEEGGSRWSKPHVATLSLHSLFELRSMLLNGTICLDMSASNLDQILEVMLDNMVNTNKLSQDKRHLIKNALSKPKVHQYKEPTRFDRSPNFKKASDAARTAFGLFSHEKTSDPSKSAFSLVQTAADMQKMGQGILDVGQAEKDKKRFENFNINNPFLKKLPKETEAANILIGEVEGLDKHIAAFIRLAEPCHLGDMTEVPIKSKFIFILLGPGGENKGHMQRFHEIGRSMATVLADEVFHDVAYLAQSGNHLLAGLDEFLDSVTVLPPGEWDPSIRIEPPNVTSTKDYRLMTHNEDEDEKDKLSEADIEAREREESGLVRTGRLFGGLINDLKRKRPWYLSDFKDGLAVQSLASVAFMYLATLVSIVTFGGLLGDVTKNAMASIESIIAATIVGVVYGLFSGQPLSILAITGPVLIFETIVFDFCEGQGWDFLPFRFSIGIWTFIFIMLIVAFDISAYICYITRFTEENFATLIALIFIKKSFLKVGAIGKSYPLNPGECFCKPNNETLLEEYGVYPISMGDFEGKNGTDLTSCNFMANGTDLEIQGTLSVGCNPVPNAYLMSLLLFFGTYLVASNLKTAKTMAFFPTAVKNMISDFAVIIAILAMAIVDYAVGLDTPKLNVPAELAPTSGRSWLVDPMGNNPWWTMIIAAVPAVLVTIVVFMDQQITAVIVNRKENKLNKGCGYHLDLFIVGVLIVVCSMFGLPWYDATTVLSINHVKSLTRESETAAPGEKPQFLGIREQRITHILIFLLVGLSVFMTPALRLIPLPVLYGVFLYMGIAALNGLQFFDRLMLFLMPTKHQPDYPYLRRVPLKRVHLFTGFQLVCMILLWVIQDIKQTAILFPIMLLVMVGARKVLDRFFDKSELRILDDVLPESQRKEKLDDEDLLEDAEHPPDVAIDGNIITVPMASGNVMRLPLDGYTDTAADKYNDYDDKINVTEEMNKSGIWQSLEYENKAAKDVMNRKKRRHE